MTPSLPVSISGPIEFERAAKAAAIEITPRTEASQHQHMFGA